MRVKKSTIYDIFLMITFVLLDRTIKIYYFTNVPFIKSIYSQISELCAVAVIMMWLIILIKNHSSGGIKLLSGLWCVFLFYGEIFISTLINKGNIHTLISSAYPMITLCMFTSMACQTVEKMKAFIHAISNLFLILVTVNFILLPLSNMMFSEYSYFMGIKNQMGYSLNLGLLFCMLDYKFTQNKTKCIVYTIIYCITILFAFSGSNIIGMIIVITFLFVRPFTYMLKKIKLVYLVIIYAVVFYILVFLSEAILSWGPINYFITDVLGKDSTLTNRTYLWAAAIAEIAKAPFIGHGMLENRNYFKIDINVNIRGQLSAHNQILQTLYEGGFVGILIIVLFLILVGKYMHKIENEDIVVIFKTFLIATMIMLLAEAPGWNALIYTGYLLIAISISLNRSQQSHIAKSIRFNI